MCKCNTSEKVVKGNYSESMCGKCQKVMQNMFDRNGLGKFFDNE